jgi:hypothetical protein
MAALSLMIAVPSQAQEPASPPPSAPIEQESSTRIIPVPDDATFIEAATLIANPILGGRSQIQGKNYSGPSNKLLSGGAPGGMPPQVTTTSVGPQQHESGFMDAASTDQADQVTAMRLYGFTLQPNEEIAFKMKGERHSKLCMRLAEPQVANPMTPRIRAVNRKPKPIRSTGFAVKNVLPEPYQLILLVYGEAGYKYRIDLTRTKKS